MNFGIKLFGAAAVVLGLNAGTSYAATFSYDASLSSGVCFDGGGGQPDNTSNDKTLLSGEEVESQFICVDGNPDYNADWMDPLENGGDTFHLAQKVDFTNGVDDGNNYIKLNFAAGDSVNDADGVSLGTWSVDLNGATNVSEIIFGIKQGNFYTAVVTKSLSGVWATWDDGIFVPITTEDLELADYTYSHLDLWYSKCPDNDPLCGLKPGGPEPIPLPAGLPLMLTAIGIGAYMRKRARKSA